MTGGGTGSRRAGALLGLRTRLVLTCCAPALPLFAVAAAGRAGAPGPASPVGTVLAAGVGLLLALVAAGRLHRRLTAPLGLLSAAAGRLAAEDVPSGQAADEARAAALLRHGRDLVAVLDASAVVTYATPAAAEQLGVAPATLVGSRLLDRVHPEDRRHVGAVVEAALLAGAGRPVRARLRRDTGWREFELGIADLRAEPAVGGLVVTARDVSTQVCGEAQLQAAALHDPLTGLATPVLFADRLGHALTGRDGAPPAVLLCALDEAPPGDEAPAGDEAPPGDEAPGPGAREELLVAVAGRLARALRARDTAARTGGQTFAVLLEDVTATEALEAAERLRGVVGTPLQVGGGTVRPRLSVGVAAAHPGAGVDELLRQAGTALSQAGQRGGDEVVVFDADLADDVLTRLELTSDLQRALQDGEFVLHYQPLVTLRTGQLCGVQAQVRWDHPRLGRVLPEDFLPLAAQTGLAGRLGLWVLETACAQVQAWRLAHPDRSLQLSVDLSGRQLEEDSLVDDVASVLALTGLDPRALVLELSVGALADRSDRVLARLRGLRGVGLRLAVSGLRSGGSALPALQRLPVDVLVLDAGAVAPLDDVRPPPDESSAATLVRLARSLGLTTVAEGVAQAGRASALRQLGCDTGRGPLFSGPLPAAELADLLALETGGPGGRAGAGTVPPAW